MRRPAILASALLVISSIAWGQSPVDASGVTAEDANSANAPLPGQETRTVPSRVDPKATFEVAPRKNEPVPPLRPGAPDRDQLSGHWSIGASFALSTPLGNFSSTSPIGSRLGEAYGLGLDVGYGFSRHLRLSLAGELLSIASGSSCSTCEATSYVLGARLRYHLVEGTRFDPWVGYGFSYRQTSFENASSEIKFDALEPIRMELGGDWYMTSVFTIGPVLSIGIDRTVGASDDSNGRWSTWFSGGLRIGLDPKGR